MKHIRKTAILLLVSMLLLGGCTLFEDEFYTVPKHTGKGYDKPVTETDNGVTMTYQFNSNVRLMDATEQSRIASVEADETNLLMQVDYRPDVAESDVPKKGEILLSKVSPLFPYGASHHVRSVKRVDGHYRLLLEYAKLEDTFKELDMDGQLMYNEEGEEEYYVAAKQDIPQTRAQEEVEDGFSFGDGKITFTIPFAYSNSYNYGPSTFSIAMTADKSYVRNTFEFNFDGFSISDDNYKMKIIHTEKQSLTIDITGGFQKSGSIKKWRPVKNKTVTAGYVVLIFFVNIDIQYEFSITGTFSLVYKKTTVTTHHVNLVEPKDYRKEVKVTEDDFNLGVAVTGKAILRPLVSIGMGIYTKTLTVRIEPFVEFGIQGTLQTMAKDQNQAEVYIENSPFIELIARIGIQVRFVADFSFEAILGDAFDTAKDMAELLGLVDEEEFYKEVNANADLMAENQDDNEYAITIGPFTYNLKDLIKSKSMKWTFPIYPKIDDNSFKIIASWDQDKKNLIFNAEYKLADNGLLSMTNFFQPVLQIRKGNQVVKNYTNSMPITSSMNNKYKFTFSLTDLEPGVSYTAVPCYRYNCYVGDPTIFDRGISFSTATPTISIVSCSVLERSYDEENDMGTVKIQTVTNLKGADNISSWGFIDMNLARTLPESRQSEAYYYSKNIFDGNHKHEWTLKSTRYQEKLCLMPFCILWKDDKHTQSGDPKLFEEWQQEFIVNENSFDFSDP